MTDNLSKETEERQKATIWLKGALFGILDASSLPVPLKKKTKGFIRRLPSYYLFRWADALNIDYINGHRDFHELANYTGTDTGKAVIGSYLDNHNAIALTNSLKKLVPGVVKKYRRDTLPAGKEAIQRQVCALSLTSCNNESASFARSAGQILHNPGKPANPLDNYCHALTSGDKMKLEKLEKALAGGRYGEWIDERLTEARRYFGLEPPKVIIRRAKRSPQWESLWRNILTGGDEN